jgi:hypothetical protein
MIIPGRKPQLVALLQAAAQDRRDLRLAQFGESQIHWAVRTGLGPLLFRATQPSLQFHETHVLAELLKGSELTARVMTAELLDAMTEIIDLCEGQLQFVTLLKGISLCESCYPEPHLRPMRDLDFLVGEKDLPVAESLLNRLGYIPKSDRPAAFFENSHQRIPLYHPERGIWVEIHRRLFSPQNAVSSEPVFSLQNLFSEFRDSTFQGRKVTRLSYELQVVYIASHWAKDWKVVGGLVPLVDLIYLLKQTTGFFDWDLVLSWLNGTLPAAHLYLALSYLQRYQLVTLAPEILAKLFRMQPSFGRINLRILHALMDQFLAGGLASEDERVSWRLESDWHILLLPGSPFRNLLKAIWTTLPSAVKVGTARKDSLSSPPAMTTP